VQTLSRRHGGEGRANDLSPPRAQREKKIVISGSRGLLSGTREGDETTISEEKRGARRPVRKRPVFKKRRQRLTGWNRKAFNRPGGEERSLHRKGPGVKKEGEEIAAGGRRGRLDAFLAEKGSLTGKERGVVSQTAWF